MILTYINKDGNFATTPDVNEIPNYLEKIGNVLFEKRELAKKNEKDESKTLKKDVELIQVPHNETIDAVDNNNNETKPDIDENMEFKYKEFLKDKKIRGFGLLKGNNLRLKALENGFIE